MFLYNHLITLFYIQSNAHFLTASAFRAIMKFVLHTFKIVLNFVYISKGTRKLQFVVKSKYYD